MKFIATFLLSVFLATSVLTATADPQMGSTSSWGVVYSPCAWCGTTKDIQVHHVWPQHLYPEWANDTNRMICLCRRCHLVLGHRGHFTNEVTNLILMIKEGKR